MPSECHFCAIIQSLALRVREFCPASRKVHPAVNLVVQVSLETRSPRSKKKINKLEKFQIIWLRNERNRITPLLNFFFSVSSEVGLLKAIKDLFVIRDGDNSELLHRHRHRHRHRSRTHRVSSRWHRR